MSEPTSSSDPEINPIVAKLSDFSDRMSPMIVKELRQGLRTRTFTGTFLILQVILGFAMLAAMMSDSSDVGQMISSMVFFLFSIVALILQPLRGVTAVASEMKDDTLEIMSLTQLTSVRIVYGKWASIISQTALMLASTIPYLVMRYFFGGMQLFAELSLLFTIFYFSACLTALTVGFSCSRSVVLRALVPLLLIPFGLMGIGQFSFGREFSFLIEVFTFQEKELNIGFLVLFVLATYLAYYFLDMGVSRIAVTAENHSFRKRMISLVLMVVVLIAMILNPPAQDACLMVMLAFSCAIGLDVCTENPVSVSHVLKPFVKRGRLAQIVGRSFFYPGWHSGFFLLLILMAATFFIGEFTFTERPFRKFPGEIGLTDEAVLVILGVFYSILAPLLVVRFFIKKIKEPFPGYILVLVMSALLTMMSTLFTEMSRSDGDDFMMLASWIPGTWILFLSSGKEEIGIVFTGFFLAVVCLLLWILASREYGRTMALETMARIALAEDEKS